MLHCVLISTLFHLFKVKETTVSSNLKPWNSRKFLHIWQINYSLKQVDELQTKSLRTPPVCHAADSKFSLYL